MSIIKSGCPLLQLPCELRDEIYSYCFDRTYKVFWPCYDDEYGRRDRLSCFAKKPVIADLSILRTSTALSVDAKNFLFCRGASKATTFLYYINFSYQRSSPPPVKEATDRMMKVEFIVGLSSRDPAGLASITEQICQDTIDRFTGTAIVRNSFRMRIALCRPDQFTDFADFVKTRFFQALKRLKGFQKLAILLFIPSFCDKDLPRTVREGVAEVVADLKTHLGPCMERRYESPLLGDVVRWSRLELEFQPREFYMESLRTEAERVIKGVDRSGEEHTH